MVFPTDLYSLAHTLIYFLCGIVKNLFRRKEPPRICGYVKPGFEKVYDTFKENFERNWEKEGASFALYFKNELIVDIWGGYANSKENKFWEKDTLTVCFSTTKAASALCLAMLVDRGLVKYEDFVIKYWPEFGKHGKHRVTVRMLASHQAGLAVLSEEITYDLIRHWQKMSRALEDQVPNWKLSENLAGYHAMTYGFLIDQLIRRVDPKRRSLGTFFREEIAEPYGIEFHIGLPAHLEPRMAHLNHPTIWQFLTDLRDKRFAYGLYRAFKNPHRDLLKRSLRNPKWIEIGRHGDTAFNEPELHALEVGAANGIGTARALAKMMNLINHSQPKVLSEKTFEILRRPLLVKHADVVIGIDLTYGHGFMYSKNPNGNYMLGHTGYGGQNLKFDPEMKLSFAFVHNGLTSDSGGYSWSFAALEKSVYEAVANLQQNNLQ